MTGYYLVKCSGDEHHCATSASFYAKTLYRRATIPSQTLHMYNLVLPDSIV